LKYCFCTPLVARTGGRRILLSGKAQPGAIPEGIARSCNAA
jgi:hypothetical protein